MMSEEAIRIKFDSVMKKEKAIVRIEDLKAFFKVFTYLENLAESEDPDLEDLEQATFCLKIISKQLIDNVEFTSE